MKAQLRYEFTCISCFYRDAAAPPKSVRKQIRRKGKKPLTNPTIDINFPPARPHADTIDSLCRNQKLRPLYAVNCLPGLEFQWLAIQAKTVNRLEKGFKQCCKSKQNVLDCADNKVKMVKLPDHQDIPVPFVYSF